MTGPNQPPRGGTLTLSLPRRLFLGLTIVVRVGIGEGGDADQDVTSVSLDDQLQLPPGLLYQLPRIMQREVLRHSPIDLHTHIEEPAGRIEAVSHCTCQSLMSSFLFDWSC